MKKIISLLLVAVMCLSLSACKSEEVKAVEEAISAIGVVSFSSEEKIQKAEEQFSLLSEKEQAKVENSSILVEAREEFEKIKNEKIYNEAKKAYDCLKENSDLSDKHTEDIQNVWNWSIFDMDDVHEYIIYSSIALQTNDFTEEELENAAKNHPSFLYTDLYFTPEYLVKDWNNCIALLYFAITERGVIDDINENRANAETALKNLKNTYNDEKYYPALQEYYNAVSSYVEFFLEYSGNLGNYSTEKSKYTDEVKRCENELKILLG